MLTIKQIEAFYWVAKLGTVQRAADKLHVTQSAATKRLQEVERLSASPLFEQAGRKATLTARGHEMMLLCADLLESVAHLEEIQASTRNIPRVVHVGVTELVAMSWFPALVRKVRTVYPQLTLQPHIDHSAVLRDKIIDGQLDVAILPEAFVTRSAARVNLELVEFAWFSPPGTFNRGEVVPLQQLATLPVIEQDRTSIITALCARLFEQVGVEPTRLGGSRSIITLAGLIEAGIGVSCLPREFFTNEVAQGRLQIVETDPPAPAVRYCAIYPEHAALGLAVAELARECCDFSRMRAPASLG
ncbi:conserved hypothetical protein [Cupriavidus necator]|uniref:HTH lysR-type domain-containing protein n=1 Tax=Cupriavidus necator TaxID=106590 RepID=A0A1K0IR19_CUPNE|nr:conserved hypothetical protein [Cupriavidus necator]